MVPGGVGGNSGLGPLWQPLAHVKYIRPAGRLRAVGVSVTGSLFHLPSWRVAVVPYNVINLAGGTMTENTHVPAQLWVEN